MRGLLFRPAVGEMPWILRPPVILLLIVTCCFGALFGGPLLGDHEALVAVIARNMRMSGEWLVPYFLDDPFVRKPPLSYWMSAAASYLLPADSLSGLPLSTAAARLPSALAAMGTVLLLWRLASQMFGVMTGRIAAIAASTSILILLFAPNATAEMALTFCCTWAAFHFWMGCQAKSLSGRLLHWSFFYIAMGVGMLAKGPAPLALVGVPLAVWWYTHRPQRILARGGGQNIKRAGISFLRGLWSQSVRAFTNAWVVPGIFIFAAVFVPWMIAVARVDPTAWNLWDWQYLQRFEGDYADTKHRGVFYFVPIVLGFVAPWTLWLFEGLLAPWLGRYRGIRKPLYFVGIWGLGGVAVMSLMQFKKPYYVAPAIPGLLLLLSVPLSYWLMKPRAIQNEFAKSSRRAAILTAVALVTAAAFLIGWYAIAPSMDNVDRVRVLDQALDELEVSPETPIYFADQRPDSRLAFYYGRKCAYLVKPSEIVARVVDRTRAQVILRDLTVEKASALLRGDDPAYLLLDREHLPNLKMLGDELHSEISIVTTVDLDGKEDGDDWIVVSNKSHRGALKIREN